MTRPASLIALLALAPAAAAAQSFDGAYSLDAARCADAAFDGRMAIEGARIAFWESACELTDPVAVRDMGDATLFDLQCRGEGETWSERVLLMSAGDGLVLLREGLVTTYATCP